MKNFNKMMAAAVLAVSSISAGYSQDCGCNCAPLASRPVVNLSTKGVLSTSPADGSYNLSGTINLSCDTLWKIDKKLYVLDGGVLNIEAGAVIKGDTSPAPASATALVIARGAKINAVGSADCPIIFTADADPLDGSYSPNNTARWGGLIILGKAFNNTNAGDPQTPSHSSAGQPSEGNGVAYIEGLPVPDSRNRYGAYPDGLTGQFYNDDNSGVLKYVSVRHAGSVIGAANEINGITLGSVGRGTIIDHVEVISNEDDGIEFFGGTVNVTHAVVMFCKDDAFDWDQGYSGNAQFVYIVQPAASELVLNAANHALELDGDDVSGRTPVSSARLFNVTAIGQNTTGNVGIEAKARTGGEVSNSIFANFLTAGIRNTTTNSISLINNSFVNCATLTAGTGSTTGTVTGNVAATGTGIDYTLESYASGLIAPIPAQGSVATNYKSASKGFFVPTNYRGAFDPCGEAWTKGWTAISKYGQFDKDVIECSPSDLNGDGRVDVSDFALFGPSFNSVCY